MLETFRQAGPLGWILVLLGAYGALVAVAALVDAAGRARDAWRIGPVALALGIACAGAGAAGTLWGRRATDEAIVRAGADLGPLESRHRRTLGYEEAGAAARIGLGLAAFPLLAGAVAMMRRPRRTEDEEIVEAIVERWPTMHGRATMLAAGALSLGVGLVAVAAPVPHHRMVLDAKAWEVLDALQLIQGDEGRRQVLWGCRKLEIALPDGVRPPGTVDAGAVRAASRVCVEERIQEAAVQSDLREIVARLEALGRSSFVKRDPEMAKPVEAAMHEVREIEASPPVFD
jgi:hypothetical protein